MDGGTYTLVIERRSPGRDDQLPEQPEREDTVTVGALGEQSIPTGWYAYTGSALGSGGFARVDRHRRIASGDHDARHWHIDYLLGGPDTSIDTVVTTHADIECQVAGQLTDRLGPAVHGFGCSDCGCHSHLVAATDRERLLSAVEEAHAAAESTQ